MTTQVRQQSLCLHTHMGVTLQSYAPASETLGFLFTAKQREELVDVLERSKGVFRSEHPA